MTSKRKSGSMIPPKKPYRVVTSSSRVISEETYPVAEPLETAKFLMPCIFGLGPWCWVRKTTNPVIQFVANATEVKDLHVYLLTGVVEGKVSTKLQNTSTPGTVYRENRRTGETTEPEPVEASATLDSVFEESIFLKKLNNMLADIRKTVNNLRPKAKITTDTFFKKTGLLVIIGTLLDLLLSGSVYVDDEIEMEASYVWAGKKHIITKVFEYEAHLPVGKVHWHAW